MQVSQLSSAPWTRSLHCIFYESPVLAPSSPSVLSHGTKEAFVKRTREACACKSAFAFSCAQAQPPPEGRNKLFPENDLHHPYHAFALAHLQGNQLVSIRCRRSPVIAAPSHWHMNLEAEGGTVVQVLHVSLTHPHPQDIPRMNTLGQNVILSLPYNFATRFSFLQDFLCYEGFSIVCFFFSTRLLILSTRFSLRTKSAFPSISHLKEILEKKISAPLVCTLG